MIVAGKRCSCRPFQRHVRHEKQLAHAPCRPGAPIESPFAVLRAPARASVAKRAVDSCFPPGAHKSQVVYAISWAKGGVPIPTPCQVVPNPNRKTVATFCYRRGKQERKIQLYTDYFAWVKCSMISCFFRSVHTIRYVRRGSIIGCGLSPAIQPRAYTDIYVWISG